MELLWSYGRCKVKSILIFLIGGHGMMAYSKSSISPPKYLWFLTLQEQLGDIAQSKMCYKSMFLGGSSLRIATKEKV